MLRPEFEVNLTGGDSTAYESTQCFADADFRLNKLKFFNLLSAWYTDEHLVDRCHMFDKTYV